MSRSALCLALVAASFVAQPVWAEPCPHEAALTELLESDLPTFRLAIAAEQGPERCRGLTAVDLNADGKLDYAAVLAEKLAQRKYGTGEDLFEHYLVVLLSSATPYSEYQAVFLLGHKCPPGRCSLAGVRPKDGAKQQDLEVVVASYSSTVYHWGPSGLVAISHQAD